ncbi:MAG: CBS domain-containing protein [Anaerolineaceae bacterium]|nr:MAG: CBS domain-containing protein [Anaerolineaceae bacterium]
MQLKEILVRDWMTADIVSVTPETPIAQAHQIMKKNHIRRLPVVEGDVLKGIVTIGDVREASPSGATTLSIWELNYLWSQLLVKDVMSHKVLTLREDDPMIKAAALMLEHKISGLPIVDENNVVIGIVTESDVFRMIVKPQVENAEV